MKQLISSMQIVGGISPTIKAVIFKAGVSNIIMREDGFNHPGIIEIYEINSFSNTE